ncbi:MAG: riboflavin synthase [Hyphomonadaceae bacterium]
MFTGIVTALGEIIAVAPGAVTRFEVRSPYDADSVEIGASIAHAGVCLTVVDKQRLNAGMTHAVEAVPETLGLTTLGGLRVGSRVNLERSLKAGEELGGHLVMGHVDGVGVVREIAPEGGSTRYTVEAPGALMPLIATKGSIAVDGVSLTVTHTGTQTFGVAIIPHTAQVTTISALKVGDKVNLEVDTVARYVARMLQMRGA